MDDATGLAYAPGWRLRPRLPDLGPDFWSVTPPEAPGRDPALVHLSPPAARLIGVDPSDAADPGFARLFAGHGRVEGARPLALVYAGRQFGVWVPQLGDGRAVTIAEVDGADGRRWEVQLKGAGRTPFSRFADGRAVMRSSLREYLCSEHMAALGIPTTRALCVVATNERVARETMEPGAVVTRLAPSHARFGQIEYFAHHGMPEQARRLVDFLIEDHFPEAGTGPDRVLRFFEAVVARTATLMADWMAVGFAHGVMNTDNMSVLGLTIDYGPFGFLDAYDPGFVCNHSDHQGRYAFDRQPSIALWNLQALAFALTGQADGDALKAALGGFGPAFAAAFRARMAAKLGLSEWREGDDDLLLGLLTAMANGTADYTLTFRGLSRLEDAEGPWLSRFAPSARDAASAWAASWRARRAADGAAPPPAAMDRVNPRVVLRNWVAETAIRAVEDRGDLATLDAVYRAVTDPYGDDPAGAGFAAPPPEDLRDLCVSCSS
jgi:uncharacterized protein YdiU (UPF0061 family)